MPTEIYSHCLLFFVPPPTVSICPFTHDCLPPFFRFYLSHLPAAPWSLSCHPVDISVSPCLFWPCPLLCLHPSASRISASLVSLCTALFPVLFPPTRPRGGAVSACPPVRHWTAACKRKEQEQQKERALQPKKQRLVFTDLQRRTLIAIFKENKRPSKEMQVTISQQLGLELNTVSNFFMNARRRCMNRWAEEPGAAPGGPAGAATFSKA